MATQKDCLARRARDNDHAGSDADRIEQRADLLARLSHDLRAPLNAIISFSQILTDGLAGQLNEEQQQQVDIIRKSGNNLLHVINNVTVLARTDQRKYNATPATVPVGGMLETLRSQLADSGQGEDTELEIRVVGGAPRFFTTDERKLLLALANMIRYAYHAGGASTVTLEVTGMAPGALPVFLGEIGPADVGQEGYLKLQLRHRRPDSGGSRIADLFLELDDIDISENEEFHGVHLGLSLARRSIEVIGGRIWIEQTADGHLQTTAVIPSLISLSQVAAAGRAVLPLDDRGAEAGSRRRTTVLVVEDNPFNRNFIRLILDHLGFEMLEAENGEIGVRKALEMRPDLILMDMMMPVMDGFQATRSLKSHPEAAGIPVLAMTALSLEKDKRKAREAGCDDFLLMPSAREVLEDKLRFWAGKSVGRPDSPEVSER